MGEITSEEYSEVRGEGRGREKDPGKSLRSLNVLPLDKQ